MLRIGIDICTALELCSKKGIVHRDIKDENIFVNEDGVFKLGDFGIARELSASGKAGTRDRHADLHGPRDLQRRGI